MMRSSNPDREHTHGQGSFFGRRKGHKLRAYQADLIETLLPRLALDISAPAPAQLAEIFDRPAGPARAHEVRLQHGDCTTEIFQ